MARIAGVNIPENKHTVISLTYIFEVSRTRAQQICAAVLRHAKVRDLSGEQLDVIRGEVAKFSTEGDLRREINMNIKRRTSVVTVVFAIVAACRFAVSAPKPMLGPVKVRVNRFASKLKRQRLDLDRHYG